MAREIICGIYCIRNIVNDKRYIGSATNIYRRWTDHRYELKKNQHHSEYLQRSWLLNGEENFEFIILEICENDFEIIKTREQYWMDFYDTTDYECGYNSQPAMEGGAVSDKTRKKMSEWQIGKKLSDETKRKMSESRSGEKHWRFGKHMSDEQKNILIKANTGRKASIETKEKMSKARISKKHKGSSSKYFGVSFFKRDSTWEVTTKNNGKHIYIGRFKKEIDAAKAYDKYVVENNINRPLNFPEDYQNKQ